MSTIRWKENKVISIELKGGVSVLAQLLKSPYVLVFNIFKDGKDWGKVELIDAPILFCKATTKQFFKCSEVREEKGISPYVGSDFPTLWIKRNPGAFKVKLWKETNDEIEFVMIGKGGGGLIKRNLYDESFDLGEVVESRLSRDSEYVNNCELNDQVVYPSFNERIFLCYELQQNVDPEKELIFDRPLREEYKCYFKIISGKFNVRELGYK